MTTEADIQGPILVTVRGLPGSGKSHISRKLQDLLSAGEVTLLDPDMTDYTGVDYRNFSTNLTAEGVDEKLHPYRYLRSMAYSGIKDSKIIIWNQAFTHLDLLDRTIKNLQAFAEDNKKRLPALVVEVEIDHDLAIVRVAKREASGGHGVTEEAFRRFINDYKSFTDYGYDIIKLNGSDDSDQSAKKIMAGIIKLSNLSL
jgi:tRNA uridine 5-carbamoylmethylation protein Kti12